MMTSDDLKKCADLLAHVDMTSIVSPCTAINVSEALKDIGRLQEALRQEAELTSTPEKVIP